MRHRSLSPGLAVIAVAACGSSTPLVPDKGVDSTLQIRSVTRLCQ